MPSFPESASTLNAGLSGVARKMFDALADAAVLLDAGGRIIDANQSAVARYAFSRAQFLSLTLDDLEGAALDQPRPRRTIVESRFEAVHRTKAGKPTLADVTISPLDVEGATRYLVVCRDVTETRFFEVSLGDRTELLRLILEHLGEAVVVFDREQNVILSNPPAMRLFGPHLIERGYALFLPDGFTPAENWPAVRCLLGDPFDDEVFLLRHAKEPQGIWISLTGRPLRDRTRGIIGAVLVGRDISARVLADRRLRAQHAIHCAFADHAEPEEAAPSVLQELCRCFGWSAGLLRYDSLSASGEAVVQSWANDGVSFEARSWLVHRSGALTVEGQSGGDGSNGLGLIGLDSPQPLPEEFVKQGWRQAVLVPIREASVVRGRFELWAPRSHGVDAEGAGLLQAVAGQLAQHFHRRRAERALDDSRVLHESLVQYLPQNIFRKDREGRFTFANQKYCDTLRRPRSEVLGKTDFDLFPEEMAKKYVADDARIRETHILIDQVEEHRLPSGESIFVHVVKTPVYDAAGGVVGVQGIFWDVTERVRAQDRVAASERRYRGLTEAIMDAVAAVDDQDRIVLFNPAAEQMFGYRSEEIVGQPMATLLDDADQQRHVAMMARLVDAKEFGNFAKPREASARRKDGTVFSIEIVYGLIAAGGPPSAGGSSSAGPSHRTRYVAAIRDLTERNKIRSALVQSEKMASLGLLYAGMAHEINNPLAYVGNNIAVLESDFSAVLKLIDGLDVELAKEAPAVRDRLQKNWEEADLAYLRENLPRIFQKTRGGVDRVSRIIHSLRGLARTDSPQKGPVRIAETVNGVLEILQGRFRHLGVALAQDFSAGDVVIGDEVQIGQVLLNLIVNAFQAMEATGRSDNILMVRTRQVDGFLAIDVVDTGGGIPAEVLGRLFDPFFTTKEVGEGTGLGLYVCHQIVSAHGGKIEVQSEPGRGTTFCVLLPG